MMVDRPRVLTRRERLCRFLTWRRLVCWYQCHYSYMPSRFRNGLPWWRVQHQWQNVRGRIGGDAWQWWGVHKCYRCGHTEDWCKDTVIDGSELP